MKVIQKITSLSLAIVFLLSSLGFTISKMSCIKTGKSKLSLVALEDCCIKKEKKSEINCCDDEVAEANPNLTAISKSDCCDINNTTFDLSDFHSSSKEKLPQASDFEFILFQTNASTCNFSSDLPYKYFLESPFSLSSRELLSKFSILII